MPTAVGSSVVMRAKKGRPPTSSSFSRRPSSWARVTSLMWSSRSQRERQASKAQRCWSRKKSWGCRILATSAMAVWSMRMAAMQASSALMSNGGSLSAVTMRVYPQISQMTQGLSTDFTDDADSWRWMRGCSCAMVRLRSPGRARILMNIDGGGIRSSVPPGIVLLEELCGAATEEEAAKGAVAERGVVLLPDVADVGGGRGGGERLFGVAQGKRVVGGDP